MHQNLIVRGVGPANLEGLKLLESGMQLVCCHEHMGLLEAGQGVLVVGVDGRGQHVQGFLGCAPACAGPSPDST